MRIHPDSSSAKVSLILLPLVHFLLIGNEVDPLPLRLSNLLCALVAQRPVQATLLDNIKEILPLVCPVAVEKPHILDNRKYLVSLRADANLYLLM
jgi:hypothetical protein